jgi:hypothetical protein
VAPVSYRGCGSVTAFLRIRRRLHDSFLYKLGYFQKHDKIEGPSEGAVRFGRSRVINIAQRQTTRQHHQEHAANARKY